MINPPVNEPNENQESENKPGPIQPPPPSGDNSAWGHMVNPPLTSPPPAERGPTQGQQPLPGGTGDYADWVRNNLGREDLDGVNVRPGTDGRTDYVWKSQESDGSSTEHVATRTHTDQYGRIAFEDAHGNVVDRYGDPNEGKKIRDSALYPPLGRMLNNSRPEESPRGLMQGESPAPGHTLTYADWLRNNYLGENVGIVNSRIGADGRPEYYWTDKQGIDHTAKQVHITPSGEMVYELDDGTKIRVDETARYRFSEECIYKEMRNNRRSSYFRGMRIGNEVNPWGFDSRTLYLFYRKVKEDADWDHKWQLRRMLGIDVKKDGVEDLWFPQPGSSRMVYYDIYSNIHYGYIGAEAGIPPEVLIAAANAGTDATGVNDGGDDISIAAGIELSRQRGADITQADVAKKIEQVVDRIERAQREGANTNQIRYR